MSLSACHGLFSSGLLSSTEATSPGVSHIVKFRMMVSSDATEDDDGDDREASVWKNEEKKI